MPESWGKNKMKIKVHYTLSETGSKHFLFWEPLLPCHHWPHSKPRQAVLHTPGGPSSPLRAGPPPHSTWFLLPTPRGSSSPLPEGPPPHSTWFLLPTPCSPSSPLLQALLPTPCSLSTWKLLCLGIWTAISSPPTLASSARLPSCLVSCIWIKIVRNPPDIHWGAAHHLCAVEVKTNGRRLFAGLDQISLTTSNLLVLNED